MSASRHFNFLVGSWVRWIPFNGLLLSFNFALGYWIILGLCYCGNSRCWYLLILCCFYSAFYWSRLCFGHLGCWLAQLLTILGRCLKSSGCLNWLSRCFGFRALTTLGLLYLRAWTSVIARWKVIFSNVLLDGVGRCSSFSLRFKF